MADRPDFAPLARAIAVAAGRMAHGNTPVSDITDALAIDLAMSWPAGDEHLCAECASPTYVAGTHSMPAPTVDTIPAPGDEVRAHIAWASNLIAQMSRQRLDVAQLYAIDEALSHLRRASELISDEVWADAPAGVLEDERGDLVVCDTCWSRRGGGGAPPDDCPECGGRGMVPAPEQHGPRCSSNPIVGCVCGLAERQSERDEALNAPDQRRTISVRGADVAVDDRVVVGGSVFAVTDIDTRDPHICLFSIAGSGVLLAAGRLQTLDIVPGSSR